MSTILILSIALIIVIAGFGVIKRESSHKKSAREYPRTAYHARRSVLTRSEAAFLLALEKRLPPHMYVFPKMRIADIVTITHGKGYYKRRNRILAKHIDFVICDAHFKPLMAIEVDGKSHASSKMQERDAFVNEIFEHVGMPLERVPVGTQFSAAIGRILERFTPQRLV